MVTSLFTRSLTKDLGNKFKQCLAFRDAKPELLTPYNDNFDFDELGKLAIDYSDGIIMADKAVNEELLKHVQDKGLPLLEYTEDFATAYEDFYDKI